MADFDKYRKANSFRELFGNKYPKSKCTYGPEVEVSECNKVGEAVLKEQQDIAGSRMPGDTDGL